MDYIFLKIGLFLLAYLLGSIPNGLLVGKLFLKIDLREHGSHNIGASNAIRVMGAKLGFLTLFLDALKAATVVIVVKYLLPVTLNGFTVTLEIFNHFYDYSVLFGMAAILGHTFPIFLKFKGGKAVATSLGVVLALTPIPGIICLLVYLITVKITHYASLGSTFAAISAGVATFIQLLIQNRLQTDLFMFIIYIALIVFIFIRHIPNYKRLYHGTERKMSFSKKENDELNK